MKKMITRISRWKFDKKMQLLVSVSIILTTLIVLSVATISSVASMKRQSIELLQAQNDTTAENIRSSMDEYKTLAIATVLDTSVQRYLKAAGTNISEYSGYVINANNVLSSIVNMHSNLDFIAVVGNRLDNYLYKGKYTLVNSRFLQTYGIDSKRCKIADTSTIRMGYNNAYFSGKRYTLNVYFPIYDTNRVLGELGLLCMVISDSSMSQIMQYDASANFQTCIVDTDGKIMVSRNGKNMGQQVEYMDELSGDSGTFTKSGELFLYQRVQSWNYYVISSVPTMELYMASIKTIFFTSFIVLFMIGINMILVRIIIRKVYSPLDKVVRKMDDVATGSLKTRINEDHMGEDFVKLAVGFNSMMEEIQVLMNQVKLEQHQIEQIRFNALQSQIQPHFLYNTLECIHWQAMADGNKDISTLVKALAKYYRICLSGGRDVIPLKLELEHVRNYLIIQNMRYDNIIGSEFNVEEGIEDLMIPKLTLQPLIENSIYHGMKVKEGKNGAVFIDVKKKNKDILIVLADTGTGMTQKQIDEMNQQLSQYEETFGYGVRNVNKRIQLLYGEEYGLYYLGNNSGGITVEITLPYVTEVDEEILRGI
ncbi:MAG: sensor histidine kinase [Lachnospiraceae bacterium]|nr:sensor histidine kinase [Lachnospiraceae bacterium]